MSRLKLGMDDLKYSILYKMVTFIWFIGGIAAFLISAGTSFYVIDRISPNMYFAVVCALAFDIVKVSGIFIEKWGENAKDKFVRIIGKFLRTGLMLVAFILCAIAISGLLLDKNQEELVSGKTQEITKNYDDLIERENENYNSNLLLIQKRLDEERTGDTDRILKLENQISQLAKQHTSDIATIERNRKAELSGITLSNFDGDQEKVSKMRRSINSRYDKKSNSEKSKFNDQMKVLNQELKSREWYKTLQNEKLQLDKQHISEMKKLNDEKMAKLEELQKTRFEGDERTQEQLITNFIKTINRVSGMDFKYEQIIVLLVIIVSGVVEITIYYTFSLMALGALDKILLVKEHKLALMQFKLEQRKSELDYEKKAEEIIKEGVFQEMEDTKNSRVTLGKIDNYVIKAKDDMLKAVKKAKVNLFKKSIES